MLPSPSGQAPQTISRKPQPGDKAPMLLQAIEVHYDYTNKRVSAVGNVQIYYAGSTLEADKVIYDETTKRLHAEGNVRLTEPDGKITYGDIMNLSDDFRDGFVDSLRLDTPDQTRFAAARADRSSGNFTVFHSGVYTACEPCKDDPKKPPLWQVKAARMIHDERREDDLFRERAARILRQAGRLHALLLRARSDGQAQDRLPDAVHHAAAGQYGFGVETPYYWALAPDYDFTFSPRLMTKQGALLRGEFRQRLINGAYSIRASGIYQLDKDAFLRAYGLPTPGYRDFRGSLETTGQFALNEKWTWGWDGILPSDTTFFQNYGLKTYQRGSNLLFERPDRGRLAALSHRPRRPQLFRHAHHLLLRIFRSRPAEPNSRHPSGDRLQLRLRPAGARRRTQLSSQLDESEPHQRRRSIRSRSSAYTNGTCAPITADPAAKIPANCLLRGIPGTYTRVSGESAVEAQHHRLLRTDLHAVRETARRRRGDFDPQRSRRLQLHRRPATAPSSARCRRSGWNTAIRSSACSPGARRRSSRSRRSSLRPNEPRIGKLPNEDSQSLIFDDSNLFKIDKFAGWDRVEGGGRANVGVQYTTQFNRGGFVSTVFGQSYQLFGTNSFATGDSHQHRARQRPRHHPLRLRGALLLSAGPHLHLHHALPLRPRRLRGPPVRGRGPRQLRPLVVSVLYGKYDAQPQIGFLQRREGILGERHGQADPELARQRRDSL